MRKHEVSPYRVDRWIAKEDLIPNQLYNCAGRNLGLGLWDGDGFIYLRNKLGAEFIDKEYHWDDGPPFGTCKPIDLYQGPPPSWTFHLDK